MAQEVAVYLFLELTNDKKLETCGWMKKQPGGFTFCKELIHRQTTFSYMEPHWETKKSLVKLKEFWSVTKKNLLK